MVWPYLLSVNECFPFWVSDLKLLNSSAWFSVLKQWWRLWSWLFVWFISAVLLYIRSSFLFGNDNKSPNCLLNAKYYLKWSHIGESISIKTAEYAMFVACASIKCSSPERRSPDQLQIWQLCGIFFTGLLQSISFFNFMSVSCLRTILTRKKSVGWLLSFLFLLVVEFFLNFFKIAVQFGGMSG